MIDDRELRKRLKVSHSELIEADSTGIPSSWKSVLSGEDPVSSWVSRWGILRTVMPVFYKGVCDFAVDLVPTLHTRSGKYRLLTRMAAPGRIENLRKHFPDNSDQDLHEFAVTESPMDVCLPEDVQHLAADFPTEFQQLWSEVGDGLFFDFGGPLGFNPSRAIRSVNGHDVASWDFDPKKTVVIYETTYRKLYCELSPGFPAGVLLPSGEQEFVPDLWTALEDILLKRVLFVREDSG